MGVLSYEVQVKCAYVAILFLKNTPVLCPYYTHITPVLCPYYIHSYYTAVQYSDESVNHEVFAASVFIKEIILDYKHSEPCPCVKH